MTRTRSSTRGGQDDRGRRARAWRAEAESLMAADAAVVESREARLDAQRRLAALRRAMAALDERLAADRGEGEARAVLVHRNDWLRDKVGAALIEHGLCVVAGLEDGADGLGVTVAEQPDLLVVEDRLPSVSGRELVRAVRRHAPDTLVAAQAEHDDEVTVLVEAGADAVFSRRVAPDAMAARLVDLLREGGERPLLVG